jgi:hypothetical protein
MSNPYKTGITQNPSPLQEEGHDFEKKVQAEAEYIMKRFLVMLPSNYVAQKTDLSIPCNSRQWQRHLREFKSLFSKWA